jgi:uncharacterized protein YfaS (alpha-2-macroglobulin family)
MRGPRSEPGLAAGVYQLDCFLAKGDDDKTLLGSETFTVREFLPDRLKIAAKLAPAAGEGWVSQQGRSGKIFIEWFRTLHSREASAWKHS